MPMITRRSFLAGGLSLAAAGALVPGPLRAMPKGPSELVAAPLSARLLGEDAPETRAWGYQGAVPGPVLRVRQGERLRIEAVNRLDEATTVHWHGLRIPHAMDGVPYLTQAPIEPGGRFVYDFQAVDAGTFWYHPHVNSDEQVARGLSGALVVEEAEPPEVDRDLVWLLDDWRVGKDGQLVPFGSLHDAAHAGRIGNVVTVSGDADPVLKGRRGERVRLRLINAANARIFGLVFEGHDPWRIAVDGHPIAPSRTGGEPVVVVPGGRVDLIFDFDGEPARVVDRYYARFAYRLADIAYDGELRKETLPPPVRLAANPVAPLELNGAPFHELTFQGGAMGGMSTALFKGETKGLRELAQMGMVWAVNGAVVPPITPDDVGEPMLTLEHGRTHVIRMKNDTAWDHPIHMHGHSFHVLARSGGAVGEPPIMDTVLIRPDEHVDVAFHADNPGDWALHCHVLEHAAAGMMGFVRVG